MIKILFALMFLSFHAMAEEDVHYPEAFFNKNVDHDINPELFNDFWKWEKVSTHWRQDINELRFTYANKKAWKTLNKGAGKYEEGAMIAKIATLSYEDSLFPNSVIPTRNINRIQLMLKDKNHEKVSKDGWVYGLYLPGKPHGMIPPKERKSCVKCHNKAKNRDYVFSRKDAFIDTLEQKIITPEKPSASSFYKTTIDQVPDQLKRWLPKRLNNSKNDFFIEESILFNGSVVEWTSAIIKLVEDNNSVYGVYDDDMPGVYLIGYPVKISNKSKCVEVISSILQFDNFINTIAGQSFKSLSCDGQLISRNKVRKPNLSVLSDSAYKK